MNPIFIPKSFEKTHEGKRTLYRNQLVQGRDIRFIEHFDKKGLIRAVNVWGICGTLREARDCFIALDENIDMETMGELRKPIEAMYPEQTKITFY